MQFVQTASLLALLSLAAPTAHAVTPVQKVIEMLNEIHLKGEQEKHDEQVRMASFNQWCESSTEEKTRTIQAAADAITQLDADITAAETQAEELGRDIEELDAKTAGWTAEAQKSQAVRDEEHGVYATTHQDYSDSLDALARAIQTLKSRDSDVPQSLLAVGKVEALKRVLTPAAHAALNAAILQVSSSTDVSAPEANAYEFQSSGVVDMLEKLQARFKTEMLALQKEEMNRKASFKLLSERLTDDINNAEDIKAEKVQAKAKAQQDAAEGKENLAQTEAGKEADEAYLRDTEASCAQRNADFEKRQALRTEELEAIQNAVEIISSPEVSGAADTYLPASMLQRRQSATSLAQFRSAELTPRLAQVASLLSAAAARTNSQLLATIAARATEDPFAKVTKMIKDLLVRLMDEANQEADHHEWCTQEVSENKKTRDEKSAQVDSLTSQVEELTALSAKLAQEISDLNDELAALAAALKEATNARAEDKAKNAETNQDAKAAQNAVSRALSILKEFYAKAATATSFAQGPSAEDQPFVFDEKYTGMQGSKGGVVGMLEVIQSDFARLEAETASAEAEAAREFKQFAEDSDADRLQKEHDARHKGFARTRAERDLNQASKELKGTQAELDAALEYYEKLRPSCVDLGLSYEERVKAREEEIQSLKEALNILNGEDLSGNA